MYNVNKTAALIKYTAKEKGKNLGEMLQNCGLNRDTISLMSRRGSWPQSNNLAKIADELECSVDYLLGRTDNPQAHIAGYAAVSVGNDFNNQGIIGNIGNNTFPINTHTSDSLDENDLAILNAYRSLSPTNRARLMVYADDIKKDEEKANEV